MRQRVVLFLALFIGVLVFVEPALAHHAFATAFDYPKPVMKRGYITKLQWTNPHVWFYINVKDEVTGKTENWGFEMGGPGALRREDWNKDTFKLGEEVIIDGSLARDGSNRANARTVTMVRTGHKFGAASSENTTPNP